jgi:hypothetical protein
VERQVSIVRDHVIAGRSFDSIAELDGAFHTWLPIRRSQVHRTHGQIIAVRAEQDRAALAPLPVLATGGQSRSVDGLVELDYPVRRCRWGSRRSGRRR